MHVENKGAKVAAIVGEKQMMLKKPKTENWKCDIKNVLASRCFLKMHSVTGWYTFNL